MVPGGDEGVMAECANWAEEIELEIERSEADRVWASGRRDGTGTIGQGVESDAQRVTENGIRFAINSHICED